MDKNIKSEIAIGIILIIAVIIGGFIWLGNKQQEKNQMAISTSIKQTENQTSKEVIMPKEPERTPEQTVKEYYESQISNLNKKTSVDNSLNTDFVTRKIIQSHEKIRSNMPANPFLCAQDFPDDASKLAISLISKDSVSAKFNVVIYTAWPPIVVTLISDNGVWKINDILCNNGNSL